jgi:hypothetical protein
MHIYIYIERERERERERVLGRDIESARGLRSAIPKNDGNTVQLVHELLAIVGVEKGFSCTVSNSLCELSQP